MRGRVRERGSLSPYCSHGRTTPALYPRTREACQIHSVETTPSSIVLLVLSVIPFCWGRFPALGAVFHTEGIEVFGDVLTTFVICLKDPSRFPVMFSAQALNCLKAARESLICASNDKQP